MISIKRSATLFAACAALFSSNVAYAKSCVSEQEFSDLATFMLPIGVDAAQQKCGPALGSDSFLKRDGAKLSARYAALSDAAWPGAFEAMKVLASNKDKGGGAALLALLSPDKAKPLFIEMGRGMLAEEIKVKDCAKIDRGMAVISELQPAQFAGLTGFIISIAGDDDIPICESRSGSAK